MHFSLLAVCPLGTHRGNAQAVVDRLMAPYNEETSPNGYWDWYQIGGRWTGFLGDYDPELDPRNIEVCNLCQGTGKRTDPVGQELRAKDPLFTCNGCDGKGQKVKWPTEWAPNDTDVQPIERLAPPNVFNLPYALLTPDGRWHEDLTVEKLQALPAKYPGTMIVVVDYHG